MIFLVNLTFCRFDKWGGVAFRMLIGLHIWIMYSGVGGRINEILRYISKFIWSFNLQNVNNGLKLKFKKEKKSRSLP